MEYQIIGPYTNAQYKGPYHIKLHINYSEDAGDNWTNGVNLEERAESTISYLNSVFNPHQIYFIWNSNDLCTPSFEIINTPSTFSNTENGAAYVLFDRGNDGAIDGLSGGSAAIGYDIPNTFSYIKGQNDGLLASNASTFIHEIGHSFGLLHTHEGFTDEYCETEIGACASGFHDECYCCGDFLCETTKNPSNSINTDENCVPDDPNIDLIHARNFMSYTTDQTCRSEFLEEQVQRMWAYLASAPELQSIQARGANHPNFQNGKPSASFTIESGTFSIDTPLEMLPGASITIKPGAVLKVGSSISGACGQMWQGIIVEGNNSLPQEPDFQGLVQIRSSGIIQDAVVGVDVIGYDPDGSPNYARTGGIVRIFGGQFVNNLIGLRFSPYVFFDGGTAVPNESYFAHPRFMINNDYSGEVQPILVDLHGVVRILMGNAKFLDLRETCETFDSRAIGVQAKDAGIYLTSSEFKNLDYGIYANELSEGKGSIFSSRNTFTSCVTGVYINMVDDFYIANNSFNIRKPEFCPSPPITNDNVPNLVIRGVSLDGNTTGFDLSGNTFIYDEVAISDSPQEFLLGTQCRNLGGGLDNVVNDNDYRFLNKGNLAIGNNTSLKEEGLYYTCNENLNTLGFPLPEFSIPTDFEVVGGSIRSLQSQVVSDPIIGTIFLPTGNIFSDGTYTVKNNGNKIEYYFYTGQEEQDPEVNNSDNNVMVLNTIPNPVPIPNSNCDEPEPCPPPCDRNTVSRWKENFNTYRILRNELIAQLQGGSPASTNTQTTERNIQGYRFLMNEEGAKILRHYSHHEKGVVIDSLMIWLEKIATYPTDLRLLKYNFFHKNDEANDVVLQRLQNYDLGEWEEQELEHLKALFSILEEFRNGQGGITRLKGDILDELKILTDYCDAAAYLSTILLRDNGIHIDLNCNEIAYRNNISQETRTYTTDKEILVFPNPANASFSIKSLTGQFIDGIKIMNLNGHIILEQHQINAKEFFVETTDLITGFYFVEIIFNNKKTYRKIFVNH